VILIAAMIVWPSGIQGGVRALCGQLRQRRRGPQESRADELGVP
jgi:hypothetical protein